MPIIVTQQLTLLKAQWRSVVCKWGKLASTEDKSHGGGVCVKAWQFFVFLALPGFGGVGVPIKIEIPQHLSATFLQQL